jgi:hypothetical protein
MTLRSRREVRTRDAANARNYEHWQTSARYGIYDRRDPNAAPTFMDMQANAGRLDRRDNRPAPSFDPDGPQLVGNVFFDKYDVASDPRNVARELKGAVYETLEDRGIQESRRLLERTFQSRYTEREQIEKAVQERLAAGMNLLPAVNDMTKIYRPVDGVAYNAGADRSR